MLTSEVLREVGALARCIQSISDIHFRPFRLQRGQFVFLTRVCENPGINLIELTQLLKVDKATTTKAIAKLAAEGYIVRRRSAEDQRMFHLAPTTKALAVYRQVLVEENRNIECCFAGFTPIERETVLRLLVRMRANIEADWRELKAYREEPARNE